MARKKKSKTIIVRKVTPEEKERLDNILAKEQERHRVSEQIGGVDERGNYTALHRRDEA